MGMAVFISLERPIPNLDHMVSGKSIAQHMERLRDMARQAGCRPLEEFVSMDANAVTNLLGDEDVKAADVEIPAAQWFDSKEGLNTVRCLQKLETTNDENLLRDFKDYEQVLEAAVAAAVRFHLEYYF
jgi:hypothetical protein